MKFLKFITLLILLTLHQHKALSNQNIMIKIKINNEIITNFDLEKEIRYLTALNPNLKNIDNNLKIKIAKDSIAKEIIKKNELKKYFELNKQDENIILEKFTKNFYINLGIPDEITFEKYLNDYGWSLSEVKQKIEIEVLWNQLIFERFNNQVKINQERLLNKVNKNEKLRTSFDLSEIIFQIEKNKNFEDTIELIQKSIVEIGFENTANLYSISDSSNIGGKIGWIDENSLSLNLSNAIKKIKIGEYTKPINLNSKFIILKLNNIKKEEKIIDKEKELAKLIKSEENRQLNNFSKIYFDKLKINSNIYEY